MPAPGHRPVKRDKDGNIVYCGAKLQNKDRTCRRTDIGPRGRCKLHNGWAPVGQDAVHFKTGRYSKHLPATLVADYQAALADPELLSLRHEIALTRAQILEVLRSSQIKQFAGKAAVAATKTLDRSWTVMQAVLNEGTPEQQYTTRTLVTKALDELKSATLGVKAEMEARQEFRASVLTLERLERSENQRMVELYNMISAERAMALRQAETAAFMEALDAFVPDRQTKAAIRGRVATRFAELTGRRHDQPVDAGGSAIDLESPLDSSPEN